MATPRLINSNRDLEIVLARMTEHDLLEVVEIEQDSALSPWGWDAYHKELQSPTEVLMLVAKPSVASNRVAGFIVSRLLDEEMHVYNVAVRQELRRQGIARRLLESALDWGRRNGARLAFLEVRAENSAAQSLYRRCGFAVTGRRKAYYSTPAEDALLMAVSLEAEP
jgi:[ribosomal protein S18]-alanine N-acetyltransferase